MPKILIADDNANIQKMVVASFAGQGVEVIAVGNGEAAVRKIADLKPDLVLADIFMPVRNGYEVCEFVKKDERFTEVPVILLVGAFDPLDEKEARRVGADGVLKKPFVPPDPLVAMVMAALEKNPRVAAELAKMREAKEPAEPHPIAIEIPKRPEPQPLPDFPEPATPEEAAIAYGFGTGKRALGVSKAGDNEPVAPMAEDDAEGETFEGAETASDWRRNAMDFEVPADVANKPAFAGSEDLDRAMFPSERDYPPRRVSMPDPVEEEHDPIVEDSKFVSAVTEPEPAGTAEALPAALPAAAEEQEPIEEAQAIEPESGPEAEDHSPAAPHWMDTLSGSSGGHTDWTKALGESPAETAQPESTVASENAAEIHAGSVSAEEAPASTFAEASEESSDSFFADEPASDESPKPWLAKVEEPEQAPVAAFSSSADVAQDQSSNSTGEFDMAPELRAPSMREPDLVEPAAVRVTPEPLLVDEIPAADDSQYGTRREQSSERAPDFAIPSNESPVAQSNEHESTNQSKLPHRIFASSEVAADAQPGQDGRFPTIPPPNREALSDIPFLMPPPDFHDGAEASATPSAETVNAVVQKVLEKLQPQLQDLLSQGVLKPLVENLLQDELAKKER